MSFETLKDNLYVWRRIRDFEEEQYYRGKQTIKIHEKNLAEAEAEGITPFDASLLATHVNDFIGLHGAAKLEDGALLATFLNHQFGYNYSSQFYFDLLKRFHIVENSLEFSPHTNYTSEIHFEDKAAFDMGSNDFTLEAWIKYDFDKVRTDWQIVASTLKVDTVSNPDVYEGGFAMKVKERTFSFQMGDGQGFAPQFGLAEIQAPLTSAHSNEWNHLAVKRIGNNPNSWKVYLNGNLLSLSSSTPNMVSGNTTNDQFLQIGDFEGEIKEVRLYKRHLTAGEIDYSFNAGEGNEPYNVNDLSFHARLNEGHGNVVYDEVDDERGELFLVQKEMDEDDDPIFNWKRYAGFGISPNDFNDLIVPVPTMLLEAGHGGALTIQQAVTLKKLKWAFYGLGFHGILDVEVPFPVSSVFASNDFTVEAWFQVDASVSSPVTDMVVASSLSVNMGTGVWSGFSIEIENDKPTVILGDINGHAKIQIQSPIAPGVWHHIAFSRLTNDPNNFEIYINGAASNVNVLFNNLTNADLSALGLSTVMVGSRRNSGAPSDGYFKGLITSVRLHGQPLTPTEVVQNFQTEFDGNPVITTTLLGDIRLDKGYDHMLNLPTYGMMETTAIIHDGGTPHTYVPQAMSSRIYTDDDLSYAYNTLTTQQVENKTRYDDSLVRIDQYMTDFGAIPDTQLYQFISDNWVGESVIQMYPVRIETKFHMPSSGNDELWVRIFPDDIEVNSHEVQLTLEEIKHGKAFWETAEEVGATTESKEDAWKTLTAKYGEKRGNYIALTTAPTNLDEIGFSISDAIWPDLEPKLENNTRPPKARILPDKFTVSLLNDNNTVIYEQNTNVISDNLKVGLDPDEESLTFVDDDIQISEMDWLLNFEEAIDVGMGLKIDLNGGAGLPQTSSYTIPKVIVSGLKISMDKKETQYLLEDTFKGHFYSTGLSMLRNASATKNTEDRKSALKEENDNETLPSPIDPNNYEAGVDYDGKLLADTLGFRRTLFESTTNAPETDIQDAKDMNDILFPITVGYYLLNLFSPWLELEDVEKFRLFFSKNVAARGPAGAFRLDNTPYGVLPVTEFGQMQFSSNDTPDHLLMNNVRNLMVNHLYPNWEGKKGDVLHSGKSGTNPKTVFADLVGRHAISVEVKKRSGIGQDTIWNNAVFDGRPNDAQTWYNDQTQFADQLDSDMSNLGASFSQGTHPEVSYMNFMTQYEDVDIPIVDEFKLSRTRGLQGLGETGLNYLDWLAQATLSDLINEDFSTLIGDAPIPNFLLYQTVRRSLIEEYYQVAANIMGPPYDTALGRIDHELQNIYEDQGGAPAGINAQDLLDLPESRWNIFDLDLPGVPGQVSFKDAVDQGEYFGLDQFFLRVDQTRNLINRLARRSTEELNNLFIEHMDLCSSRLDAWMTGLVTHRMETIYQGKDRNKAHGLFYGGFGWVNNLTSSSTTPYTGTTLPGFIPSGFNVDIEVDSKNGGYIQTPSINHAVAAAVIRSGYMSRAHDGTSDQKNRLSTNLSSKRIRQAKTLIEGLNNGQSLGAMLGYFFERRLHEIAEDDEIYGLRKTYPFDTVETIPSGKSEEATTLAVVDGLALVRDYRANPGNFSGFSTALKDEIEETESIIDALGDVAIAEGLFQIAQSSTAAAGSMTKAVSEGGHIREADVNNTPRKGIGLTNRVAVGFPRVAYPDTDADQGSDPWDGSTPTERSKIEPSLNQWLKQFIADPDQIAITASYTDTDAVATYLQKSGPTYHRVSGRTIIADETEFSQRMNPVSGYSYVGNDADYLDVSSVVSGDLKAKAFVFDGEVWSADPVFLTTTVGNIFNLDNTAKRLVFKNSYKYKDITIYDDGAEVAFYHCEEGNGTVAYDQSGRGNDASISASSITAFHVEDVKSVISYLDRFGYNKYLTYNDYKSTYDTGALVSSGNDWAVVVKGVAGLDGGTSEYILIDGTGTVKYKPSNMLIMSDGVTTVELPLPATFAQNDYHELILSKTEDSGIVTVSAIVDGDTEVSTTVDSSSSAIPSTFACVLDVLGNSSSLTQYYRYAEIQNLTSSNSYVLLSEELEQTTAPQSESGSGRKYPIFMVLDENSEKDTFNGATNNIYQKYTISDYSYEGNATDYLDVSAFVVGDLETKAYVFDGSTWSIQPEFLSAGAGNVQNIDNTQKRIVFKSGYRYKGIAILDDGKEVAFYNAEEGDGVIAFDQSGFGNNGAIVATSVPKFHGVDAEIPINYLNLRGCNKYWVYDDFKSTFDMPALIPSGHEWTAVVQGVAGFDGSNNEHVVTGTSAYIKVKGDNLVMFDGTTKVELNITSTMGDVFTPEDYHEITITKTIDSGVTTISAAIDEVSIGSTTNDFTSSPIPSSFQCMILEIGNSGLKQFYRFVSIEDNTSSQKIILIDSDLSLVTPPISETGTGSKYQINMVLDYSSTNDVLNGPAEFYGRIHSNVVNNPCLKFSQNEALELDSNWDVALRAHDCYVETILEMPLDSAGVSQMDILANTDLDGGIIVSLQNGIVQVTTKTDAGATTASYNGALNLFSTYGGAWCRLGILLNRESNAFVFVNGKCVEEFDISASSEIEIAAITQLFKNYSSSSSVDVACQRLSIVAQNTHLKSNVDAIDWTKEQTLYLPLVHTEVRDTYSGVKVDIASVDLPGMEGNVQDFYSAYALYGFNNRYAKLYNEVVNWTSYDLNAGGGSSDDWQMEITAVPAPNADETEFIFAGNTDNLKFVENDDEIYRFQYIDNQNSTASHKFGEFYLDGIKGKIQRIRIQKLGTDLKVFVNGIELEPETPGVDNLCSASAELLAQVGNSSSWTQLVSRFVVRNSTTGIETVLVDKGEFVETPDATPGVGVTENMRMLQKPGQETDIFGNEALSHPYGVWLYDDVGYKVDWATAFRDRNRSELDAKIPGDTLGVYDSFYFYEGTLSDVFIGTPVQLYQVTLNHLGLQPIDFLFISNNDENDDAELAQRVKYYLWNSLSLDPSGKLVLDFTNSGSANLSFADLSPLTSRLHKLVSSGTILKTSDITPDGNDEFNDYDYNEVYNRVSDLVTRLNTVLSSLTTAKNALNVYNSTGAQINDARTALMSASEFALTLALPTAMTGYGEEVKTNLLKTLDAVIAKVTAVHDKVDSVVQSTPSNPNAEEIDDSVKALLDAVQEVFGRKFKAFAHFNNGVVEQSAFTKQLDINSTLMDDHTDPSETVETWLQGAARVRKELKEFEMIKMLQETLNLDFSSFELTPFQFPYDNDGDDRWMAVKVTDTENLKYGRTCFAYSLPANFDAGQPQVGLLIDEWTELIPERHQDAGIAFHHNQPNSKAPKVILSAVAPMSTVNWSFDTMKTILAKTLDRVKTRTLDFEDLSDTPVGQLAPMLVFRK